MTWNPVRGCSRVSEGCRHCYAERMAARNLPEMRSPTTGKPFAVRKADGPHWTGKVELIPEKLTEPLRWRKPRRVFVNSMSDLFHENLPFGAIDRVFRVMAAAPQHTFQILTKRPQRMLDFLQAAYGMAAEMVGGVLPNVWLGVSVEDQATADERIPLLLRTPAAVRFVSYEPALGPVDFEPWLYVPTTCRQCGASDDAHYDPNPEELPNHPLRPNGCLLGAPNTGEPGATRCNRCGATDVAELSPLNWIIVGGESGPGARPFRLSWAVDTVRACREAGVAVFVKQLGARPIDDAQHGPWPPGGWSDTRAGLGYEVKGLGLKGGGPSEWPEDLRVREFPA